MRDLGEELVLRTLVNQNGERRRRGESIVASLAECRALEHVALYAQAVAHWAASRPGGAFALSALEATLTVAARSVEDPPASSPEVVRAPGRRVLHVATETPYPEGGHSRVIERWMRWDGERQHSLAMTSPRNEVPASLESAIRESGGKLFRLAPGSSSFLRRATELRSLASAFDILVVHVHDYDAVAPLALTWPGRPPTIRMNHNGHLPWLGRGIGDVVACGRQSAIELCVARRGIPREACAQIPVPPSPKPCAEVSGKVLVRRHQARSDLGLREDELVLLTVASHYKVRKVDGIDLRELVGAALTDRTRASWLVAGPTPDEAWLAAETASGGRIRRLDARTDLEPLYATADLFVDSWPFTSQTTLLDAASHGLPLLAPQLHPSPAEILGAWGGSLDVAITAFHDVESLVGTLHRAANPEWRTAAGERARQAVVATRTGWCAQLEAVYALAAQRVKERNEDGSSPSLESPAESTDELDLLLAAIYRGDEPWRAFVTWHRDITNRGSVNSFPGDEAWLADTVGLPALVGELELIIRDYEALVAQLRAR